MNNEKNVETNNVQPHDGKPHVMRRLKSENKGWVIACYNHPSRGTDYIVDSTFSYTRKDAIKKFVEGSGSKWEYWKSKYNFRAVKASNIVSVLNGA